MRSLLLFLSTLCFSAFPQEQSTIDITTHGKDVEILVDGKSVGCHDHISITTPPGRHLLEGRKPHHFSDWEKVTSRKDTAVTVTLQPRPLHFTISVQVQPMNLFLGENMPMLSIDPGLRFWPMYLGLHGSIGGSGTGRLFQVGAHIDYLYDYRNIFEFALGGFVAYYQFDKDQEYTDLNLPPTPAIHINGGSVCPEMCVFLGREHFFIVVGFTGIFYNTFSPLATLGFVISP
jgi:hypothetical protein